MTFVITQPCIDTTDQSCVEVCPVDCIHFEEGVDLILYIDPVECIDCGACEPVCPVDAIFTDDSVPADQQHFTAINALWFQDKDAARARVAGVEAPEGVPAPVAAAATATAAAPEAEAEPEEEQAAAALAPTQVEALDETPHAGVIVPRYTLPAPAGLIAASIAAIAFVAIWIGPGPHWPGALGLDGPSIVGTVLGGFVLLLAVLVFVRSQARELSGFAASHERRTERWREAPADWRRSEESRGFELARAVERIAAARFPYPTDDFPRYQTHINVPEPSMALDFGAGGEAKAFPDILVVEHPGNYPVMIAQVETSETLTRAQVERVWARLEIEQAPLDVYVPAGLAARAKDYARAAGIRHIRFRTWRTHLDGVIVREL